MDTLYVGAAMYFGATVEALGGSMLNDVLQLPKLQAANIYEAQVLPKLDN